MIDLVLGLETAACPRPRTTPRRRDVVDRRAGAHGALLATRRRRERKTADPRPRNCDLIENAFNQVLDATDPGGVTTFGWDGNGNQTTRTSPAESTEYTWDARDRLSEIALPDGTTAGYGYDTENLRVSMDDADGARRVLLDGLEEWGELDEATGELTARFDHDPTRIDALLAQDDAAGRVGMLTDALGSVYGLADDAATLRARYGYDVYGARSASVEEIETRWGFSGRRTTPNAETGIVFARNRYLDGVAGSWLAEDPLNHRIIAALNEPRGRTDLLLRTPANRYYYAFANPTREGDPLGLQQFQDLAQLQVFAGAAAGLALPRAPTVAHYVLASLLTLAYLGENVALGLSDAGRQLAVDLAQALEALGALFLLAILAPLAVLACKVINVCALLSEATDANGTPLCLYTCPTGLKFKWKSGPCRRLVRENDLEFLF